LQASPLNFGDINHALAVGIDQVRAGEFARRSALFSDCTDRLQRLAVDDDDHAIAPICNEQIPLRSIFRKCDAGCGQCRGQAAVNGYLSDIGARRSERLYPLVATIRNIYETVACPFHGVKSFKDRRSFRALLIYLRLRQ